MNNDQIYLDKAIFIDSKKGKITEHYKFLKEVELLECRLEEVWQESFIRHHQSKIP